MYLEMYLGAGNGIASEDAVYSAARSAQERYRQKKEQILNRDRRIGLIHRRLRTAPEK